MKIKGNAVLVVTVVMVLLILSAPYAFAGWAFDVFTGGIDNGTTPVWTLTDIAEYGGAQVGAQSLNPAGPSETFVVAQPMLRMTRGAESWTGFGMCIDIAHVISVGAPQPSYSVFDWAAAKSAARMGTINPLATTGHSLDYIWNRLTYMWSVADITSDSDRAALQMATWLGCADQWNGNPGANLNFWNLDPVVQTKVNAYLSGAVENNSSFANQYVVFSDHSQTFAGAVPEPSSLMSLAAMLSFAGVAIRFRKR